jgi:hypothetical protein
MAAIGNQSLEPVRPSLFILPGRSNAGRAKQVLPPQRIGLGSVLVVDVRLVDTDWRERQSHKPAGPAAAHTPLMARTRTDVKALGSRLRSTCCRSTRLSRVTYTFQIWNRSLVMAIQTVYDRPVAAKAENPAYGFYGQHLVIAWYQHAKTLPWSCTLLTPPLPLIMQNAAAKPVGMSLVRPLHACLTFVSKQRKAFHFYLAPKGPARDIS